MTENELEKLRLKLEKMWEKRDSLIVKKTLIKNYTFNNYDKDN